MTIDVSDVLVDADLSTRFSVKRRAQSVNQQGRVELDVSDLDAIGVICAASPDDLKRVPDYQFTERAISVVTPFRLRATAPDYAPDLIGWEGVFFIVRDVQPYAHFGRGFVQAIATSIDFQDAPAPELEIAP